MERNHETQRAHQLHAQDTLQCRATRSKMLKGISVHAWQGELTAINHMSATGMLQTACTAK